MTTPHHVLNWYAGWYLLLSAFVTGALLGLFFYREDFLGGYTSFRRRILRLGHIAQAALGMLNILFSYSPWPVIDSGHASVAQVAFVIGGLTMPAVCFLSAWQARFRHLFFVPVIALSVGVIQTLRGAP